MTTPLVQAIARAIADGLADFASEPRPTDAEWQDAAMSEAGAMFALQAQAALTAITEAGYAVVPVDFTNALEASHIALDDWLHTYAPDECGEEYVQTTRGRIFEAGGTLAYIADLQQENRRILNMISATNTGKGGA